MYTVVKKNKKEALILLWWDCRSLWGGQKSLASARNQTPIPWSPVLSLVAIPVEPGEGLFSTPHLLWGRASVMSNEYGYWWVFFLKDKAVRL
jgi:hypothetical protein